MSQYNSFSEFIRQCEETASEKATNLIGQKQRVTLSRPIARNGNPFDQNNFEPIPTSSPAMRDAISQATDDYDKRNPQKKPLSRTPDTYPVEPPAPVFQQQKLSPNTPLDPVSVQRNQSGRNMGPGDDFDSYTPQKGDFGVGQTNLDYYRRHDKAKEANPKEKYAQAAKAIQFDPKELETITRLYNAGETPEAISHRLADIFGKLVAPERVQQVTDQADQRKFSKDEAYFIKDLLQNSKKKLNAREVVLELGKKFSQPYSLDRVQQAVQYMAQKGATQQQPWW